MILTELLMDEHYDFIMETDEMWVIYQPSPAAFSGLAMPSAVQLWDTVIFDA